MSGMSCHGLSQPATYAGLAGLGELGGELALCGSRVTSQSPLSLVRSLPSSSLSPLCCVGAVPPEWGLAGAGSGLVGQVPAFT